MMLAPHMLLYIYISIDVCVYACREGGRSRQTPAMYRAAVLLESYQRQVQSLDGELREVEENIDTAREVPRRSRI
jgi:hypothetical protein